MPPDRTRKVFSTSLLCIFGILIAFGLLYYLPEIIRPKLYSLDLKEPSKAKFPLDLPLRGYSGLVKQSTTLRELLQEHPKGLLINFWATWCPPCLDELPSLEVLQRELAGQEKKNNPFLLTVSVDEKTQEIKKLFDALTFRPSFPVYHDSMGNIARSVGTTKFPETYWLDNQGNLVYKWIGPQNWTGQEVLARLAGKTP